MTSDNEIKNLSQIEIRILGSLIEKQRTTPNQYPLTLNSLQLACNQATSRNPIVQFETSEIQTTVHELIEKDWIAKNQSSARAEKYEQRVDRKLGLNDARLAIVGILMLRADQTLAEIKNHSQRLYQFNDVAEVKSHIDGMMIDDDNALIVELPKKPGTKENRYAQLLGGDIDIEEYLAKPHTTTNTAKNIASEVLIERIEKLEQRIETLEQKFNNENFS